MHRSPFSLPDRCRAALEALAARPALLVCVLLAVNALVFPYRGLFHDARLYAAQLLERSQPGWLATDLYLRFGSQDSYSIFSALMLPLVHLVGLEPAFFVGYLVSKVLLFAALVRLVPRLLGDPIASTLSLLFLSMAPLPFGGNEVYHINEPFLTPRIAAVALALFAIERALAGKSRQSAALIVLGLLIHPVMAFGGALVLMLWALFARLSRRTLVILISLGVTIAGAIVLIQPLGRAVFGHMDDEWRSVVYSVCFFADPLVWTWGDWGRVTMAVIVTTLAGWLWRRDEATLTAALVVAGLLGVAGNFAASFEYALLIKASPYRTLWPLELLAIPFAFLAAVRLWQSASAWGPPAGLLLLVLVTADSNPIGTHPLYAFLAIAPVAVIATRGLGRTPAVTDWPAHASAATLAVGVVVLLLFDVRLYHSLFQAPPSLEVDAHPARVVQMSGDLLYRLPLLAVVVLCVTWLSLHWRMGVVLAALALTVHGVVGWLDMSETYNARFSVTQRHVQFVRPYLAEWTQAHGQPPTVYWEVDLRDIWFRGHARAYFHSVQLSGSSFNRATAIEGRRRARLARAFEADRVRRMVMGQRWWQEALEVFHGVATASEPTANDLLGLCSDEELDFIIVPQRFEGLYRASDGEMYLYDCGQIRQWLAERSGSSR